MGSSNVRPFTGSALLLVLTGCGIFGARPEQRFDVTKGSALAFTPSGYYIAASGVDSTSTNGGARMRIWAVKEGLEIPVELASPYPVSALAFWDDASRPMLDAHHTQVAGVIEDGVRETRRICIWYVGDGRIALQLVFPSPGTPTSSTIAYTASGTLVTLVGDGIDQAAIALYRQDGTSEVHPLGRARLTATKGRLDPTFLRAELSPDGTAVAIGAEDNEGTLEIWPADGKQQTPYCLERHARSTAFAVSLEGVAAATSHDTVKVWSRDGALKRELRGGFSASDDRIWVLALSPHADLVAAAGFGGRIRVWSVADGTLLQDFKAHNGAINALRFSPAGDRLASRSWDGTVKIWAVPVVAGLR